MSKIQAIKSRQILDSRGNPTLEVDVYTDNGKMGRAAVPSGASTGSREALELRDGDSTKYLGKSVTKAVGHVNNELFDALKGMEVTDQKAIDEKMLAMDGTEFKSNLGANALLGVSLATAKAGAASFDMPLFRYLREHLKCPNPIGDYRLPAPMMNIINGGAHAANNLDIQEFMIVPHLKSSFSDNLRAGVEVFHHLKKVLTEKKYSTNVGDEGGFAPNLASHQEAMELIATAISRAGYRVGDDISFALDAASSEFYNKRKNVYEMEGKNYNFTQMTDYYDHLASLYPLYSVEDGLDESDHEGWTYLTKKLGKKLTLVGDDLFVTNPAIFKKGIAHKEANAILIKVNQIGTLTETFQTLAMAYEHNYKTIISHRSGETADSFIADLAVASGSGLIKTGSASRSDRLEKYNQLLRIEEELGIRARFDGLI